MALKGIRVLEFAGLAPVPFCGMILADFGAQVIRIDRINDTAVSGSQFLSRGKLSIAMDLKQKQSILAIKKMIQHVDVLIEPYRPGVMEKLGLGPEVLLELNPKLIFARLTGFGQSGPLKNLAGHDINYLSLSGMLSAFKRNGEKPMFPGNILGDFAAGSLMCAFGIVTALYERTKSGKGQIIDSAILDGTLYLGSFIYNTSNTSLWDQPAGNNILDSGAPNYDVYETKDGEFMAVGALEPQFYRLFVRGLGFSMEDENSPVSSILDRNQWLALKELFSERFKQKTRAEWEQIFNGSDACVSPVLKLNELDKFDNTIKRNLLAQTDMGLQPSPVPVLSRTPGSAKNWTPKTGENSLQILKSFGFSQSDIDELIQSRSVYQEESKENVNHLHSKL